MIDWLDKLFVLHIYHVMSLLQYLQYLFEMTVLDSQSFFMIESCSQFSSSAQPSATTLNLYRDPKEAVISYINRFIRILNSTPGLPKNENIEKFRKLTKINNFVGMYFQAALDSIPEFVASLDTIGRNRPGILYGMKMEDVLDLMNVVVQTPPCYSPSEFSGVPFNSILIDIINTPAGQALFSMTEVNEQIRNIFNDYAAMLKSEKSLAHLNDLDNGWLCSEARSYINYDQFECDISLPHFGFKNWNDWFTRRLLPGARPVEGQNDPLVIVQAAENYPLTTLALPVRNVKASDLFWLKENRYSLYNMFEAHKMHMKEIIDESFVGGTIYQGFLSPWCYHWWHAPVSGTVEKCYLLPGSYFLQNPSYDLNEVNNYDNSQPFLSCVSVRQVIVINTHNPKVGRVALIEIGMVEVSTCICLIKQGENVKKGQPIGRFEFGGSSHVIIFDKRAQLEFNPAIQERTEKNGFELSKKLLVNSWLARAQ